MKKGMEIVLEKSELKIYHQNFPKKQIKAHQHSDGHLFIPLRGSFIVSADDSGYKVDESLMLDLPSHCTHAFESSAENGDRIIVQFKADKKLKWPKTPTLINSSQLIKELLFQLLLKSEQKSYKSVLHAFQSVLSELTMENLSRFRVEISNAKDQRLIKFINLLEEHPERPLNDLIKQSAVSSRNLLRLSLKEIGISPKDLQTYFRMEKAKRLLMNGMSVTDVSLDTGYNSLSTFIQNFRDHTGELPSALKTVK